LGVPRSASKKEIKRAFRKLAQQWHPDKYRGDFDKEKVIKKMSEINQAYEVLSNDGKISFSFSFYFIFSLSFRIFLIQLLFCNTTYCNS